MIGNRVVDIPVGKGLGGTTNVNATLCTPPAADDFASWPSPWNDSLMHSVEVIQDEMVTNDALYHHTSIDDHPYAALEILKESETVNNLQRQCVFPSLMTAVPLSLAKKDDHTFVRRNYYDALIEPLLRCFPHLMDSIAFIQDFEVQRLLFDRDDLRVVGVEGPEHQTIYARSETIVCAGAIESPALLLLSGIGHRKDLEQAGVCPKRKSSCAAVGRGLRDHILVPRVFLSPWSPRALSPNGVHAIFCDQVEGSRFQFIVNDAAVYSQLVPHFVASVVRRRFIHTTLNLVMDGVFRSLRFLLTILVSYTPLYFFLRYWIITVNIALLNPKSTGTVTVRQKESLQKDEPLRRKNVDVLVDAGYLSDPTDIRALRKGWDTCTERFDSFFGKCVEVLPGVLFRGLSVWTKESPLEAKWFDTFVTNFSLPYFHWCGTCAMKNENEEWVVDSSLRVRDIPGLRVCDASVFPTTISGPTALTCAALGHGLADILLDDNEKKDI